MTSTAPDVRRYRFGPRDRSGWLLGLGPVPCAVLGAGFVAAGFVLKATGSVALTMLPVAAAAVAALARYEGRALHEWWPPVRDHALLRAQGRDRWWTRLPVAAGPDADLPPFLEGLAVREVAARRGPRRPTGVAVVVDAAEQTMSAVLRVHGGAFALLEAPDQARVLDGWGSALAGFARERGPITRVSWSEWAAPAALDEHSAYVREQRPGSRSGPEVRGYLELVAAAGPLTIGHDTLVTVTLDTRRVRTGVGGDRDAAAVDALLDELHLFSNRLEEAGLTVDPPLGPGELALALRLRSDPSAARRLSTRAQRLAERAAVVSPRNLAPLAVHTEWRHVRVDQAWHRSYWVAEWPRLEVPAEWLSTLLLNPGGVRTVAVVHEPVAASRSRRAVDREATRLSSDEDERVRRGFRVRAQHRRAESEVLAREQELVAGYVELRYAGFVTVTVLDPDTLDDECAEWEQVAAQAGLELRALDGQHDLALAATLSLGRVPAGRGRG